MEQLERENAELNALLKQKKAKQELLRAEVKHQLKDLLKEKEALSQQKATMEQDLQDLQRRKAGIKHRSYADTMDL